jgi:hypothetical protein
MLCRRLAALRPEAVASASPGRRMPTNWPGTCTAPVTQQVSDWESRRDTRLLH